MEKTFGNMETTSCGVLGPGGIEKRERRRSWDNLHNIKKGRHLHLEIHVKYKINNNEHSHTLQICCRFVLAISQPTQSLS